MGVNYRLSCERCDAEGAEEVSPDASGALVAASRGSQWGSIAGCVAYLNFNDELILLRHPAESRRLAAMNVTWTRASLQGRLFYVVNMICPECGVITGAPRIHYSISGGCLIGLSVVLVSYLLLRWYQVGFAFLISLVIFNVSAYCADWAIRSWLEFRYRDRILKLKKTCCDGCGSQRIYFIGKRRGVKAVCSRCGEKSLKVEIGGIS